MCACECECMCGSVSDGGCKGLSLEVKVEASDNGVRKDLLQDTTLEDGWIIIDLYLYRYSYTEQT